MSSDFTKFFFLLELTHMATFHAQPTQRHLKRQKNIKFYNKKKKLKLHGTCRAQSHSSILNQLRGIKGPSSAPHVVYKWQLSVSDRTSRSPPRTKRRSLQSDGLGKTERGQSYWRLSFKSPQPAMSYVLLFFTCSMLSSP